MTICRYWQQGTCTFGSSCRFEHIGRNPGAVFSGGGSSQGQDIVSTLVTTVKQDVEQSSKGKQWLFSCYSPAKDCASIPGIDDISPEEMRHDAYTAKVEGSSAQYQQKYQELQQAYNQKRQALANPSNELKEVYRKIYNKENLAGLPTNLFDSSKQSVFGGGSGSNPFGGTQQSSSVFGGQTNSASTGLFGGQQSSSTTSLFGAQPATNSIIFGGQSSTNTSSVFGGQQASTATNSVFGGSSSLFGGQQSASGSSGLFGGGAAQQQQSKSVFGGAPAFGSPNATGSVFGQTQAAQSTFGAPSAFGAPQNQGSSIFGGTSAFSTPTSTPSMFGGQTNLSAQPNNFGQPQASVFAQQQPPVSSAASGSIFGQQLQPQNTTSTFGQSAAQPPQPQGSSVFGAPQQATPASNIFSAATSISLFGQQPDQHTQVASVFGNQPQAASVFGNQPQAASVFGNQPQQPQAAPFAQAQNQPFPSGQPTSQNEPATKLGSNPFAKPSGGGATGMFGKKVEDQLDSSIYSLLESLTAQDLEAFKAPSFSLGLIPERPPPRELCVA